MPKEVERWSSFNSFHKFYEGELGNKNSLAFSKTFLDVVSLEEWRGRGMAVSTHPHDGKDVQGWFSKNS